MSEATAQQRFVKAWDSIKNPDLDGENPHFGNKFASLKATLNVIREVCDKNGIAYLQQLSQTEDGKHVLKSSILADDGQAIPLSVFPVEAPPNPQSFGSNLTYAKRQQAQADWGITGEHDDDGEAGARAAENIQSQEKPDKALMDAKQRLWNAIKTYAEIHGADPKTMAQGVEKRPDYRNTVEYLLTVAEEFESELANAGYSS